jgi:hypothetical protein
MESSKKFVVDSGSARGSNITSEEVHQALRDMDNWLHTNIPSYKPNNGGGSPSDFPQFLSLLISNHDGGIQLHETFKTLSVASINLSRSSNASKSAWPAGSIPFASSNDGDLLIILASGEVSQWNEDGIVEHLAQNLGLFIENLRNKMLSRKFQYLGEDCGLIEGV